MYSVKVGALICNQKEKKKLSSQWKIANIPPDLRKTKTGWPS